MSAEPSRQGDPMQPPLLDVRNVTKTYGGGTLLQRAPTTVALQDFSLTLAAGQPRIVAIAGESGSGKTTAARLVLGFHTPTTGEIFYRGKSLAAMSGEEARTYRREVQAIM